MSQIEKQLPIMLISWLSFPKGSHILLFGETVVYADFLCDKGCTIEIVNTIDGLKKNNCYDFVFVNNILEISERQTKMLQMLKASVKPTGTIYIGADNRLGLRYFCGEKDPYTDRVFDGIESYKYVPYGKRAGRCFSRIEIEEMLQKSGYTSQKFYSVFPCLEAAQFIFSDSYRPNEELSIRYTPLYRQPNSVVMHEEKLFADVSKMGMLGQMANSYLIECTFDGNHTLVQSVSVSYDRGEQQACTTIHTNDGRVIKRAVYPQGNAHIWHLAENMQDLREHQVPVVDGILKEDAYVMPYLVGPTGNVYLQELMLKNVAEFIEKVDHFKDLIMRSSEVVGKDEYGIILKKGYFDMIPLNSVYYKDEFVFIDQEFFIENCPLNIILYRMIYVIYDNSREREEILPKSFFWERYSIMEQTDCLRQHADIFLNAVRNKRQLQQFNDAHMRNNWMVERNRKKIMTTDFYEEHKRNCFKNIEGKKVVLFGSGRFADKFLAFYRYDYQIIKILDNNQEKWGTSLQGIPIEAPESIMADRNSCKVIICIKDYENVFRQLKRMGVPNIGIYDAYYVYPGCQQIKINNKVEQLVQKKYHIGYISGVFDLFHIGHVNILRRAKEQCDYLIAAVTSDEYVRNRKKREPFIPFDERLEVVKACRYVDEAVGVPFKYAGTIDAFQKYHFDCQFVGSDYAKDPWWLKQKEYLEKHSSTLVFLPYTEQTNSTKIKALIEQKLV